MSQSKFISFLEAAGRDFKKGLAYAVQYAMPVAKLVGLLFPAAAPEALGVANAADLLQVAVLQVEQKYAAAGIQDSSGPQKLAEVLLLTQGAVTSLLKQEGITADQDYVAKLVNAVVAILNVQSAPAAPAAA